MIECVLWSGYIARDGYGRVNRRAWTAPKLAHRFAYESGVGPIPVGHEIHHLCGNRACIRLAHLKLVTREQHREIEREARTHCHRGHPYSEYARHHKGRAAIYCAECKRLTTRARRERVSVYQLLPPLPESSEAIAAPSGDSESGAAGLKPPWQPTEAPPQVPRDAAPLSTEQLALEVA